MSYSHASSEARDDRGGYVVRKPRASDAVGSSLRNVYDADPRTPGELTTLLRRLDAARPR